MKGTLFILSLVVVIWIFGPLGDYRWNNPNGTYNVIHLDGAAIFLLVNGVLLNFYLWCRGIWKEGAQEEKEIKDFLNTKN